MEDIIKKMGLENEKIYITKGIPGINFTFITKSVIAIKTSKIARANKILLYPNAGTSIKPAKNVPNILPMVDNAYKLPINEPEF